MEVGKKIGQYLKDNGIKQAFLVEKTGLSANVISDICNGVRKTIDCIEYYKICKALGVALETFVDDEAVTA
jgi:transcriptional regulator with XRE-family HTH domain